MSSNGHLAEKLEGGDFSLWGVYKGIKAGKLDDPNAYRPISLINIATKVLTSALLARITPRIDRRLLESQNRFRTSRSTDDSIFILRRLTEEAHRTGTPLYILYIDLTKAYDRIPRIVLWEVLGKMNIHVCGHLAELIKALYDGTTAAVKATDGSTSAKFDILTGVKQGCALSCILFNGVLDCIIRAASQKAHSGVKVRWRLPSGRSCRGNRVQGEDVIGLSSYADDIAQWSDDLKELQQSANVLAETLEHWGLAINTSKTKLQIIQPKNAVEYYSDDFTLHGVKIEQVKQFTYLGTIIDEDASLGPEIRSRIKSAQTKIHELKSIWNNKLISRHRKSTVFKIYV